MAEKYRSTLPVDRKSRVLAPYTGLKYRSAADRIQDFNEVLLAFDEERARLESRRCIQCPEPAGCMVACPLHNDIPGAMWLAEKGDFIGAANIFRKTSPFPEVCGRVCPHEFLCQGSCVLVEKEGPVLIGAVEAYVADLARHQRSSQEAVSAATGKRVAVIGGGPAGLSCASGLIRLGHTVTVFDRRPLPGGLLLYGIPGFKMHDEVYLAVLRDLTARGIQFETSTTIGVDKSVDDLLGEGFDAVFIGTGTIVDHMLGVKGEDLNGVYRGIDFLIRANVDPSRLPRGMDTDLKVGRRVVVIGGGDTASDCLRTAIRLGAEEVACLYRRTEEEMTSTQKDRKLAREEGARFMFLTQPMSFIGDEKGRLTGVECIKMELGAADKDGRRRPVPIEGSNFVVEADAAVLALGFSSSPLISESTPGLETDNRGLLKVDPESLETSRKGVFAGGDAVRGPDLVVTAAADGKKAAAAIHDYLTGKA